MPQPSHFNLVGGSPALDLVNTVSWRGDPARAIDRITDFTALVDWALRTGVVDRRSALEITRAADADPRAAQRASAEVRRLREDLHRVLSLQLVDGRPDADALAAVNTHIAGAIAAAQPAPHLPLEWQVQLDRPAALHDALALDVLRLLSEADPQRIGRCSNVACGWLFLDHSRNRSRRWCSSQDCGNRERVNRHHRLHGRSS